MQRWFARFSIALKRNRHEWPAFLAFVAPNFILFAIFTYWPIIYSFFLSFTRWNFLTPDRLNVGWRNYQRLLMEDPNFWKVMSNTLTYAISVVLIAQGLAFLLALLLNRKVPGQPFFRTIAFTPHITTTAAAALVWVLLLDPRMGPLSYVYNLLGVAGPRWLTSTTLALWAIIVVGIWKEIGFSSVFFLAGLQGINRDYYEAAEVDGASGFAVLRHVTLPLMTPVIFFLMVSGFIQAIKAFDVVAIMTDGGPVYPASATYVYHLYQLAFRNFRAGYASAFAILFFIVIIAITLFQIKFSERWVQYGD
ncbi:MAG TPA: sugar ABC transporter permease [Candidatus Sulfomarinibacteraceae bacterium]|nr:sugar ABC transporter permease [Candidatus Sulfomarinibacteraceae bacterium]